MDRNITLYAKWIDYLEPSVITINLESAGTVVTCNFWQLISEGVTVDWGDGTEYTYGTVIQVPDNSIIISRQDRWITDDGKTAYSYSYHPFSVLISNLGTVNEHVYGIKDLLTDKVYHLEVVE